MTPPIIIAAVALLGWALTGVMWWRERCEKREERRRVGMFKEWLAIDGGRLFRAEQDLSRIAAAGRNSKNGTARMMARMASDTLSGDD
jgi:hypothetical protein